MNGYRYGGFWRRAIAIIIDELILYFLFFILVFVEGAFLPSSPYATRPGVPPGIAGDITAGFILGHFYMLIFISAVYFTHFHAAIGQTPGKMLLRLKVVGTSGNDLTYGVSLLRWIGYLLSTLPFCLGFVWAAFDSRKQGFHDKIADTIVILANNYECD